MSAIAARVRTLPGAGGLLLFERNVLSYKSMWPIIVSGFFEPLFFLLSLGYGLGNYVGDVTIDGVQMEYAVFVAPGLLAASAMNGAFYDATNIFWKLRYQKLYDSVLSTPLGPKDVAAGETVWALFRGLIYAVGFFAVILALGLVESWWALLALPATVFIGFAFAGAGIAAVTYMRSWQDFDIINLAILPMFLFSATFFPLSAYPGLDRGRDPGDAALPRRRPAAGADDGCRGVGPARERRVSRGARHRRHVAREQADREAAADLSG